MPPTNSRLRSSAAHQLPHLHLCRLHVRHDERLPSNRRHLLTKPLHQIAARSHITNIRWHILQVHSILLPDLCRLANSVQKCVTTSHCDLPSTTNPEIAPLPAPENPASSSSRQVDPEA